MNFDMVICTHPPKNQNLWFCVKAICLLGWRQWWDPREWKTTSYTLWRLITLWLTLCLSSASSSFDHVIDYHEQQNHYKCVKVNIGIQDLMKVLKKNYIPSKFLCSMSVGPEIPPCPPREWVTCILSAVAQMKNAQMHLGHRFERKLHSFEWRS